MTSDIRAHRNRQIDSFLDQAGYKDWDHTLVAGDASFRRYERLSNIVYPNDETLILMDAPPPMEDIGPFIQITELLHTIKDPIVKAPHIFARDRDHGFLVLSDLGDENLKMRVDSNPEQTTDLYTQATDILLAIHKGLPAEKITSLPCYDKALYWRELLLFSDWYMPATFGHYDLKQEFLCLWRPLIDYILTQQTQPVLVLRDYHAENMMLQGDDCILIDYQDAVQGHAAYDLVSLTQDARRLVSRETEEMVLDHYLAGYRGDTAAFKSTYAILGVQRAMKIIGIFHRLYLRDGKSRYLDFIPHMWAMVSRNMQDPLLAPLNQFIDRHFPAEIRQALPNPEIIGRQWPVPEKAMVLSAGKGTRMGALSDHTPKPLVSVAGKTLLDRVLDHCFAVGVSTAVVNVHHLADQVEDACAIRPLPPEILIADEREKLLETGGGVMQALPLLGSDPFYVINSDALWVDTNSDPLLQSLAAAFDADKMDILLAVLRVEEAPGYDGVGDLFLDEATGKVTLRGEHASASHMFAGVRIMHPDCFFSETVGVWSMRRLFRKAEASGRLYGCLYTGTWLHVGDPDSLDHANQTINNLEAAI